MDELAKSWSGFSEDVARDYLVKFGSPSPTSRRMLVDIVSQLAGSRSVRVLDLACGNGNLFNDLAAALPGISYTGVDFSEALVNAARSAISDSRANFILGDASSLSNVQGEFDIAIYSHVIEMLGSPEQSLHAASRRAKKIVIRFFEPPEFEYDQVELRPLEYTDGKWYLRRKMGKDYYNLILSRIGCTKVDVYQDETSKDQIHVLHYPQP